MNKVNIGKLVILSTWLLLAACGAPKVDATRQDSLSAENEASASSAATTDVTYAYAIKALKEKRYREAIKLLRPFVNTKKPTPSDMVNMGIAYRGAADYENSAKWFAKAAQKLPQNIDIINEIAVLKREQGKFKQAKSEYKKALAILPNDAKTNYNLAVLCDLYLQDYNCALKHLKNYQTVDAQDEKVKVWLQQLSKQIK